MRFSPGFRLGKHFDLPAAEHSYRTQRSCFDDPARAVEFACLAMASINLRVSMTFRFGTKSDIGAVVLNGKSIASRAHARLNRSYEADAFRTPGVVIAPDHVGHACV